MIVCFFFHFLRKTRNSFDQRRGCAATRSHLGRFILCEGFCNAQIYIGVWSLGEFVVRGQGVVRAGVGGSCKRTIDSLSTELKSLHLSFKRNVAYEPNANLPVLTFECNVSRENSRVITVWIWGYVWLLKLYWHQRQRQRHVHDSTRPPRVAWNIGMVPIFPRPSVWEISYDTETAYSRARPENQQDQ